jgi:PRTRC genetic system protein B
MHKVECRGNSAPVYAKSAIILYGSGNGGQSSFASVHDVRVQEGKLVMEEGVPASINGLRSLFAGLEPAKVQKPAFLPSSVLSSGPEWLVWWVPPQYRAVWFDCKELGKRGASVPNPGLVFAVSPVGWQVFAVKGKGRPCEDTALFQAPYFNVWNKGTICVGSAEIPKGSTSRNTKAWEEAFFSSFFTHPNIHVPNGLIKHPRGPYAFWKEMLDGKFKRFPEGRLVPSGTMANLLASITRSLA